MTDTKNKDFISRIAIAGAKKKLTGLKDKPARERLKALYSILRDLNTDQIAHVKQDLLNFERELSALKTANRELSALKTANREIGGSYATLMFDRAEQILITS